MWSSFEPIRPSRSTFANILSTTGTWFTTIALFVLAAEVSGLPELAVGLVLVLRMFALAFPQPFTGMLADRYSRKGLDDLLQHRFCLVCPGFAAGQRTGRRGPHTP